MIFFFKNKAFFEACFFTTQFFYFNRSFEYKTQKDEYLALQK